MSLGTDRHRQELPRLCGSLNEALDHLNERGPVQEQPLSGGDINRAYRLITVSGRSYFIKRNSRQHLCFFETEDAGLTALRRVGALGVPEPLAWGTDGNDAFLILPFLEAPERRKNYWALFGAELAELHRRGRGDFFGFHGNNFIGATAQINEKNDSWVDFFRTRRLAYQIERAAGYWDSSTSRRLRTLLDRLDNLLPEPEYPSLLHGDLWSGNVLAGPDGKAWIIDPAAYYGHREADLAMTELFGAFPREFYTAYDSEYPREPGYADRRDLYNLYHLINHLNLFGPSYLGSVKAIVNRYV